jgi:hypothetical protein
MPTDLPSRRPESPTYRLSTLRLAVVDLRLRLLGWRIEQALEERDHIKFLHYLNAWADLHRRTLERLRPGIHLKLIENRNTFCDRLRESLSKIAREERRLTRVAGRMKLARMRGNSRDYARLDAVGKNSHDRTLRHWQHISLSFHSRR